MSNYTPEELLNRIVKEAAILAKLVRICGLRSGGEERDDYPCAPTTEGQHLMALECYLEELTEARPSKLDEFNAKATAN